MQLGNFSILKSFIDRPNEVANFLKEILRELTEPVIPFDKYPQFRDLEKTLTPQQRLKRIVMMLRDLPEINRSTLLYVARFFHSVSLHSEQNLMNSYNLAVIITPNLFRSQQLTNRDLLNHGTLTDVFTMIMANVDKIIQDINKEENNDGSLVNQLLKSQDGENQLTQSQNNRFNNRQTVQHNFNA